MTVLLLDLQPQYASIREDLPAAAPEIRTLPICPRFTRQQHEQVVSSTAGCDA